MNPKGQGEARKNSASHNKFKKKPDMKEMQCYCNKMFGLFTRDCYFNKEANDNDKEKSLFSHAEKSDS